MKLINCIAIKIWRGRNPALPLVVFRNQTGQIQPKSEPDLCGFDFSAAHIIPNHYTDNDSALNYFAMNDVVLLFGSELFSP